MVANGSHPGSFELFLILIISQIKKFLNNIIMDVIMIFCFHMLFDDIKTADWCDMSTYFHFSNQFS